ncbi:MAG: hypothetical protein M0P71_00940 [Melioribacteraceae bacterium]|nr:hypothetical protein [Melioribacteraceae bacterium]
MKLKLSEEYKLGTLAVFSEKKEDVTEILDLLYGNGFKYDRGENRSYLHSLIANVSDVSRVAIEIGNNFQVEYKTHFKEQRKQNSYRYKTVIDKIIPWNIFKNKYLVPELGELFYYINFKDYKIIEKRWEGEPLDFLLKEFGNIFNSSKDALENETYIKVKRIIYKKLKGC